jgi:hypothetical protein
MVFDVPASLALKRADIKAGFVRLDTSQRHHAIALSAGTTAIRFGVGLWT